MTLEPAAGEAWQGQLAHSKHVAWRRVGEEVVILDLESRSYFSLNGTGGHVWELIGKGLSEEAICEEIADAYGQSLKAVRKDVYALIKKLKRQNLVTDAP